MMKTRGFTIFEALLSMCLIGLISVYAAFVIGNSEFALHMFHQTAMQNQDLLTMQTYLQRDFQDGIVSRENRYSYSIRLDAGKIIKYQTDSNGTTRVLGSDTVFFQGWIDDIRLSSVRTIAVGHEQLEIILELKGHRDTLVVSRFIDAIDRLNLSQSYAH